MPPLVIQVKASDPSTSCATELQADRACAPLRSRRRAHAVRRFRPSGNDREYYDFGAGTAYEFHDGEIPSCLERHITTSTVSGGNAQKRSVIIVSVAGVA